MYIKVYRTDESILVAVCDSELIGRKVKENGLKLDISEEFYRGYLAEEAEVRSALQNATTANIVGERSVKAAVSCGVIDASNVIEIGGIPHAQMYSV